MNSCSAYQASLGGSTEATVCLRPEQIIRSRRNINKKCETSCGLSLRIGRLSKRDGSPTREKPSIFTFLHYSLVGGTFSMGK